MLLDLDGFKKINDTLGHTMGDELIKAVAERLQGCVRRSDTIARIGGDEFSLIMMGVGQDSVEMIAKKVLTAIQRPFRISEHALYISASLGISIYPEHGEDSLLLYRIAEMAMYRAKSLGKNHWRIYSDQVDGSEESDLSLESAIMKALRTVNSCFTISLFLCTNRAVERGGSTDAMAEFKSGLCFSDEIYSIGRK